MNQQRKHVESKPWRGLVWPLVLGAALGCATVAFAQLEMRWMVYLCLGVLLAVVFAAIADKERFLFTAFFLALQVDIYLRLFLGAGGWGLAFALVSFIGLALFAWCIVTWPPSQRHQLVLAGSLKWPILGMLGTTVLSFALSSELIKPLERTLTELQLFGVYWITLNMVRSERDVKRVLMLMFVTLAIQSLIYFVENGMGLNFTLTGEALPLGETPRPGGTVSSNPAGYTSFVMPILMIAIAFFIARRPGLRIPFLPFLILAGVASVGLSYTRAAWVGLGLGIVVMCIVARLNRQLKTGRVVMVALSGSVVLLSLIPVLLTRLQSDYAGQSTVEERWNLILIALNVIRAHPIAGVGPGTYADFFKGYVPPGLGGTWLYTVHNEFLLRAAETGIAGGLAFVALIFAAYRCALRVVRENHDVLSITAMGWIGGLTAIVWQMCWVPWRGFSYNAIFWMFLGLMDACDRMVEPKPADGSTPSLPPGALSARGGFR